jgi:hypothetical protein
MSSPVERLQTLISRCELSASEIVIIRASLHTSTYYVHTVYVCTHQIIYKGYVHKW